MTILYALDITPVEGLDLTIMSFAITGPVLLLGIVKFGMFRILPSVSTQVANLIQDGLVVLDENREIAYYNDAAIRILKINRNNFFHKDIRHIVWLYEILMENNNKSSYEKEVIVEQHPEKWLLVTVNEIKNEEGLVKGNLLLMHDITNRKRLEQHTHNLLDELDLSHKQMKEANNQKDRIVSIIAHDLRTPFHQISNLSSITIDMFNDLSNAQVLEFISDIKNASENGTAVLEELLGWAKMQQKNANSSVENFHVDSTLKPIIESMNLSLKEKKLSVDITGNTSMQVITDNNVFTFVSRNLLANAIKFSNPGNKITIHLEQDKDINAINFIDQGIGIPNSDLSKLFDSKVKYSRPGTNGEKGSGIGLLLCKEMIERIDGKIEVDSQEGIGSTFTIKLQNPQV
jgi:signal transduction histidine kinase